MTEPIGVSSMPTAPHIKVFSISGSNASTQHSKDQCCSGHVNPAYETSLSTFSEIQLSPPDPTINNLGLGELSDIDDALELPEASVACASHVYRTEATYFCVECLLPCCPRCSRSHHNKHQLLSLSGEDRSKVLQTLNCESFKANILRLTDTSKLFTESLVSQDRLLEAQLRDGLDQISAFYTEIIQRVNNEEKRAKERFESIIQAERNKINSKQKVVKHKLEMLNKLQTTADALEESLAEVLSLIRPGCMTLPLTQVKVNSDLKELKLPETKFSLETEEKTHHHANQRDVEVSFLSSVGSKGSDLLQFTLPSGVCVDRENNLYVADEGNNRIQRISNEKECIGSFTWGEDGRLITDVAYNPTKNLLIVPRAYSEKGMLRCSSFSYVSLDGQEMSRFNVKGMVAGLFLSFDSEQNVILITDTSRKSVFVIRDGEVLIELIDHKFLQQPLRAVAGRNGDIVVTDGHRGVISIFNSEGQHIRDIGQATNKDNQEALKLPKGIAIDKTCSVIAVSDWRGDKVLLYSYEGQLLTSVTDFKCPHSIALTDNHRLVVSDCWNSQVKVYEYSNLASAASTRM